MRFLGEAAAGLQGPAEVRENARRAEDLGYDVLVLPDHLLGQHAPVPLLATVAAATTGIRVGTFVFNAGLRHPAVLAQDLASLDVLSGGRLEIGIGAGWNKPEHDAIGIPFPPFAERAARLEEAVSVLKGCFADGPFSYEGTHFTVSQHDGLPKPVQRPHPPFFIGGGGKRTLQLAAREADTVGLAPRPGDPRSMTLAATREKVAWVREAAGGSSIELNVYPSGGPTVITDNARHEVQQRVDAYAGLLTEEEVAESPHVWIGSVAGLAEKAERLREELGIGSIMTDDVVGFAPVMERIRG